MAEGGRERRRFPRRRTRDSARAYFDGRGIDCLVIDVSEGGLGLLLRPGDTVPDRFGIETKPNDLRQVEVVWRSYPQCGVIFRDRS